MRVISHSKSFLPSFLASSLFFVPHLFNHSHRRCGCRLPGPRTHTENGTNDLMTPCNLLREPQGGLFDSSATSTLSLLPCFLPFFFSLLSCFLLSYFLLFFLSLLLPSYCACEEINEGFSALRSLAVQHCLLTIQSAGCSIQLLNFLARMVFFLFHGTRTPE